MSPRSHCVRQAIYPGIPIHTYSHASYAVCVHLEILSVHIIISRAVHHTRTGSAFARALRSATIKPSSHSCSTSCRYAIKSCYILLQVNSTFSPTVASTLLMDNNVALLAFALVATQLLLPAWCMPVSTV